MTLLDLGGQWRLERISTGDIVPAVLPGDTHSALLSAGKIPDPYAGANELDVQWVGREDWAFERDFDVEPELLASSMVLMDIESLDTVGEVFLNGRKAASSDNMFIPLRFDAKPFLKEGKNVVRILIRSAENAAVAMARKLPYPIPYSSYPVQSPNRNLIRKVQCHSGWDWGPCLMVAGVYGGIRLVSSSDVLIEYVYSEQTHDGHSVRVRVTVECTAAQEGTHDLVVTLGEASLKKRAALKAGTNTVHADLVVEKPRLWWPNGYGTQELYPLSVTLGSHTVTRRIGLRAVELVTKKDRIGTTFFFRVNGVDVFAKGADWIPTDAMPSRQTREVKARAIESAVRANMNMLRVWGGGQYESDDFYELCDQAGIMLWQDFMFACSLYPATPRFLQSVDREARHQIKRLRDHPSIALWCGNNENLGALRWYKESQESAARYLVDYDRLTEGVIGKAVDECDPTRRYWPSSPCSGRDAYSDNWHDDRSGDMHYWNVWHEGQPFSSYYSVTPRFCSEFGYQSFPSMDTIRSFAGEDSLNATSPVMEHHQRGRDGNSKITEMFTRYFRVPEGFESFVYLSQVQQALAIKTAVEYWRTRRPICMGTLYWQLNDNWPGHSWSSIEYGGKWKLLHYQAARFFAPVLLTAYRLGDTVEVWVVNDNPHPIHGKAEIAVMSLDGRKIRQETIDLDEREGSARLLARHAVSDLAPEPDKAFMLLSLKKGGTVVTNELFFTEPKRCTLGRARVSWEAVESAGGFTVELSTDLPAFYVSLDARSIPGEFDDNCFSLEAGGLRKVSFAPRHKTTLANFKKSLSVMHLRETYR